MSHNKKGSEREERQPGRKSEKGRTQSPLHNKEERWVSSLSSCRGQGEDNMGLEPVNRVLGFSYRCN